MKYWVQYYQKGLFSDKLIEVCGDRGIIQLDGRNSLKNVKKDAVKFNGFRRPTFDAYQILQGERLLDVKPVTEVIEL